MSKWCNKHAGSGIVLLSVVADWVIVYADLLVDYVEYDDEWMVLMKCCVGRLENFFLGGWMTNSCLSSSIRWAQALLCSAEYLLTCVSFNFWKFSSTLAIFAMCTSHSEESGLDDFATGDFECDHLDPLLASLQCEGCCVTKQWPLSSLNISLRIPAVTVTCYPLFLTFKAMA